MLAGGVDAKDALGCADGNSHAAVGERCAGYIRSEATRKWEFGHDLDTVLRAAEHAQRGQFLSRGEYLDAAIAGDVSGDGHVEVAGAIDM